MTYQVSQAPLAFHSMTVAELKTVAKGLGLKGYSKLRKTDLVHFINGSKQQSQQAQPQQAQQQPQQLHQKANAVTKRVMAAPNPVAKPIKRCNKAVPTHRVVEKPVKQPKAKANLVKPPVKAVDRAPRTQHPKPVKRQYTELVTVSFTPAFERMSLKDVRKECASRGINTMVPAIKFNRKTQGSCSVLVEMDKESMVDMLYASLA